MVGEQETKMKKKLYVVTSIGIVICIMLMLIICLKNKNIGNNNAKEHRREWWLKDIGLDNGEKTAYTGKGVVIAVVDTGIEKDVPEFCNNIIAEYSVENKQIAYKNISHGTAICGIIAGKPSDDRGIKGIASDVDIISIDVTDDEDGVVECDDLVNGIRLAINNNVDIINISVGCLKGSNQLENVIKEAIQKDIIIVASAGNYMSDSLMYPAAYDKVIAVGSLDRKGKIISPKGKVDKSIIYLPGTNIVSVTGRNKYSGCDGTSFSAAMCSGLVALLLDKKDDKKEVLKYLNEVNSLKNRNFIDIINAF